MEFAYVENRKYYVHDIHILLTDIICIINYAALSNKINLNR